MSSTNTVIPDSITITHFLQDGGLTFSNILFDPNSHNKIYTLKILSIKATEISMSNSLHRLISRNIHGNSQINYSTAMFTSDILALYREKDDFISNCANLDFLISTNKDTIDLKIESWNTVEKKWVANNHYNAILQCRLTSTQF